jgi:hypothetical protein
MLRRIAIGIVLLLVALFVLVQLAGRGTFGRTDGAGEIRGQARPDAVQRDIEQDLRTAAEAIGVPAPKQILFGDLHVHTTLSFDAFMASLPVLGGEGAHPPADACDFARYCSALDFWSINDHAEAISAEAWQETIGSIRQCNERSGDPANPDSVAFLGWEWTQVGTTPEDHFGHKNVVVRGTSDEEIPARPIAATGRVLQIRQNPPSPFRRGVLAFLGGARTHDLAAYLTQVEGGELCEEGVNTRELPRDCVETAPTPASLFRKLDEWGFDSVVIPHGTTWGFYTPPGAEWGKQLVGNLHDEERQTLFEIYSGHGDSEVHRPWRASVARSDGGAACPDPTPEYEPACWRAGEILRERCLTEGSSAAACDARAAETRRLAAEAGVAAHLVVQGERPADWLDAGQCRDCSEPAFNYRPGGSAQYVLALGNFDADPENPRRFRMGFLSSSDNHTARPGTGYKEKHRRSFTESSAGRTRGDSAIRRLFRPSPEPPDPEPLPFDLESTKYTGFQLTELERQASFFTTGGLVAVHAEGRDRDSIWDGLERREVYGTSGPRILLWFDLLNPPGSRGRSVHMGGEVGMAVAPVFQVRAVGSFEQKPGCPDWASEGLGSEGIEHLCRGECYHPSDVRRRISRIEVVRIRPQSYPDEDVTKLIDDPWRTIVCEASREGCTGTFVDPDFPSLGRDTVYYARVFEEPAPAINAAGANCEYDAEGRCLEARLCTGDGDCLAPHEPRAWSSPIFVDFEAAASPGSS